MISSDDDLFVLNLAKEKNGVVVSLDQFRDAYSTTKDREIKNVIKHRFVTFTKAKRGKTSVYVGL